MTTSQHLLSVVVPTYNQAPYLQAALASVADQLYSPLELIVIDDGSTDATAEIAAAFFRHTGLLGHYRFQSNQGPAAARNLGLSLASGAWIAFLDSDDLWLPAKTTRQLQLMEACPEAEVIWGGTMPFTGDTPMPADWTTTGHPPQLIILLQSMLFRRAAVERLGLFDRDLRMGEDIEWIMHAAAQPLKVIFHRDPVALYRRHANSLTSDRNLTGRSIITVARRLLERRRSAASLETAAASPWISLPCPDA